MFPFVPSQKGEGVRALYLSPILRLPHQTLLFGHLKTLSSLMPHLLQGSTLPATSRTVPPTERLSPDPSSLGCCPVSSLVRVLLLRGVGCMPHPRSQEDRRQPVSAGP